MLLGCVIPPLNSRNLRTPFSLLMGLCFPDVQRGSLSPPWDYVLDCVYCLRLDQCLVQFLNLTNKMIDILSRIPMSEGQRTRNQFRYTCIQHVIAAGRSREQ